jgi:unspecific monooxygenase
MVNQLPNPVPRPAWWQMLRWISDPLGFQDYWSAKYKDWFTINLTGLGKMVIISNSQAIQEIFAQDAKCFDVGRANNIGKPIFGKNSLLLMDGDRHKRERKLLMPPFHGERLQHYAQQICQITETITSKWQKYQNFKARNVMQEITQEVIIQVVFGLREGERYQAIKPLLSDMLNMTDAPISSSMLFFRFLQTDWSWSPWGQMQKLRKKIYELLQTEIDQRRKSAENQGKDILSLMMAARDENGNPMTDEELKDELMTLLFAGHETTATILAWAFYQIHKNPEVLRKLTTEIAKLGANPDPMVLAKLPYLNAVCQETLRMYPVIPILLPRIAKQPIKIMDYTYDTESVLAPSIYLVHYREDLYPQPQEFKPERFLERQYSPSEYLPFGGGNRRCLGYALAELEMRLVLATILANYKLQLADNKLIKSQRRGFALAPKGGVSMLMVDKVANLSTVKDFATLAQ